MDLVKLILGDTAIMLAVVGFGYKYVDTRNKKIKELEDKITEMEIERVQLKSTIEMLENKK